MKRFQSFRGKAAPLPQDNIDTDQIVPARFLARRRSDGLETCLFHDQRFNKAGAIIVPFALNQPHYRDAQILLAGSNFGCGSSREHAVYALLDYGFRAVVAPSFGAIFFQNSLLNGLLPIVLPQKDIDVLLAAAADDVSNDVEINLESQTVASGSARFAFEIDPFRKECMLLGLDDIDFTLRQRDAIDAYEGRSGIPSFT
jgi:3-isopropylmalate/(R)-2-methylmalate dehydratase small subunit